MHWSTLIDVNNGCKTRLCSWFVACQIKIGTKAEAADGINRTALREIKLLQELSHPNVIGVSKLFITYQIIAIVY